jgi:NhaP-type Na+/H+ or K+/H+ antiporter
MTTITLLLFGSVLLVLVLADRLVRRLPLTPAVIYLAVGWCAGAVLGAPSAAALQAHAALWTLAAELVVLGSLLAVGLRLRMPPSWRAWRVALLLAGPGVLVATALGTLAAAWLLALPWPAALVLAAVMAPTDPVLASEVQIRSEQDRDAVRLSLTAEGGLNDGSALPAVMLGLALMGWAGGGAAGEVIASPRWWALELVWPIAGGALLGQLLGRLLGRALRSRGVRGDPIARDELLYVGAVALAWGLARATHTSAFVLVFVLGATMLEPLRQATGDGSTGAVDRGEPLWQRLQRFGGRIERLVEAATVLAVGVALHSVTAGWRTLAFGVVLVVLVRPLSVLAVVGRRSVMRNQRRLLAWFGIRGVGSLYYLAFVIEQGVHGQAAETLMAATLTAIAVSIVLHGVSATPLMTRYHARSTRRPPPRGP